MNLKKIKILDIFLIFILCFLFHFSYNFFPNSLTAIFFLVNESIWEHIKIIYTSIIFYGIIDYFILIKNKISFNNFFTSLFFSSFLSIILYLIIYIPIYQIIGHNLFIPILLLFLIVIFSQYISYIILNYKKLKLLNIISIVLIIIVFTVFGYFTYYPIENYLFYDIIHEKYGINIYKL